MTLTQKINCKKLAQLLDVSPRTIRNWANDPNDPLPGQRVKGVWLFDVEQVQAWLERQNDTTDTDAVVEELLNNL